MADPIDIEALALEVGNGNFDDERLNSRLRALIATLATDPARSLPQSFDSAGLEAAYRFFSNVRVTPEAILEPHWTATRTRTSAENTVLILHDTTTLSYRYDGERRGLARVQRSNPRSNQAFFAHYSLAVAADGTRRPLGVAAIKTWVRDESSRGIEYQRWEEQVRLTSDRLDAKENGIHVMDREADDYQMFHALIRDEYRFVARCLHNRWLEKSPQDEKLHALFSNVPATVEREIPVGRRKPHRIPIRAKIHPARDARIAKLSIGAATVALKRPQSRREFKTDTPKSLTINVVRVWEPGIPVSEGGVEWYLYTTEPIETPEQQLAIVDYYRNRWVIEEYFKALKTGCEFESRQLQDYESLANLLATFSPIAYRMLLIRSDARRVPNESALAVLTPEHVAVLRAKGRTKLSENPTVRDVYLAIAILGGHIKYSKSDPGWLTLARGLEKLETLTEGWLLAKLQHGRDQR